jgi:hypothetical protein
MAASIHFLPPPAPSPPGLPPGEALDKVRELALDGMTSAQTRAEWERFAEIHRLVFRAQIRAIVTGWR